MMVTPNIIIEEGEEKRLGYSAGTQFAQPAQSQGESIDHLAVVSDGAETRGGVGLHAQDRSRYFADAQDSLGVPAFAPNSTVQSPSAAGTNFGLNTQPAQSRFRQQQGYHQESAEAWPESRRGIVRMARNPSSEYERSGEADVDSEAGGDIDRWHADYGNELGARRQLAVLQRERLSLEIADEVSIRRASSPARIENIVAESLADDPKIQGYRQELYEIDTMLVQRQAIEARENSPALQELQKDVREVQAKLEQYRAQRERELREQVATMPNAELQAAVAKRRKAKERLDRQIAELERQISQGPKGGGDRYARIYDNPFKPVSTAHTDNRLSTLSIDVDTAAYANVRQFLMQSGQLPPADAVRIEELVNYFHYDYQPPTDETPFAANLEVASCPWAEEHRLVRIGIKGREMDRRARPQSNLVFLVDVSGSMNEPNKLPLVVEGLKMLAEELGENDRVAIVVYASSEGLVLPSTAGIDRHKIMGVLDKLRSGGSTAGGAGIKLAYKIAQENFVKGGVNRVILCTDGDFNVGIQNTDELEQLAERSAKKTGVFLTVLGFGRGNLNDEMMERISGKGNGNYFYVDGRTEAHKVLVQEMTGTLVTIAKDVKLQVEFNPTQVAGYRLIGYENRVLAAEDFNDDKKDAGEIGAGHTVTALYEVVPFGQEVNSPGVDALKYEQSADDSAESTASVDEAASDGEERLAEASDELLTLKIRYKQPDGVTSTKLEFPVTDSGGSFADASDDFQFAAAVASFGMLLRDSPYQGHSSFAAVAEIAEGASLDHDPHGRRREFVDMARRAGELSGE
ncbi:MAG: hypothetical protein CMJ58_04715 [Planctomycetaceae bacterium]|nr:hypothetical protein [Planctomycetaceae bacterium]